jgi:stage V sporulation protein B
MSTAAVPAKVDAGAARASAGRGLLSITGAKLYFIVGGYAMQIALPRLLGSPEDFGLYSSAMNVVSILNNVLIAATLQTVSKHVSADLEHADATLRQGLLLQLGVGAFFGGGLLLLAPWLAGSVLRDDLLTPLLRTASVVVLSYALYAALVGALNGRQRFVHQAGLDVSYTTLRAGLTLGAAGLGFGVAGAMTGFAAAAVAVLAIALFVVGVGKPGPRIPWGRWLAFMGPLWLYQLCLNLVLQVDLSVLKGGAAALAQDGGMTAVAAAEHASRLAGFYRAAQTFAFVPYQLILSVTFVVFPMVSHAVSLGDEEATRRYIRAAMRFSLMVLLAVAAPIAGASAGVMRVAYPGAYLAGADALAILAIGVVAFALFVIGSTILSGAGQPGLPAVLGLITVGLVVGGDMLLLRMTGPGEAALRAVATGTSLAMGAAMVGVAIALKVRFGAFLSLASGVRLLGSGAVGFLVARTVPSTGALLAVAALVAGGLAYVAALVVSRELGRADLEPVLAIVRRRRGG